MKPYLGYKPCLIFILLLISGKMLSQTNDCYYKEVNELPILESCKNEFQDSSYYDCTINVIEKILSEHFTPDNIIKSDTSKIDQDVNIVFTITNTGDVIDAKVLKMVNEDYNGEFERLINLIPKFIPVKKNNNPICIKMHLTIELKGRILSVTGFEVLKEMMPTYPGCEDIEDMLERDKCASEKMMAFIYANIQCPEMPKRKKAKGVSVTKFTIDKEGNITNVSTVKSLGFGCDEEAVRVIKQMPKFNPGYQLGQPVDIYFYLPIKFDCK